MKKIQTRVGRMSAEFEGVDFQGINSGDMTPLYVSSFNALFSDFNLDYAIGFDGGLKRVVFLVIESKFTLLDSKVKVQRTFSGISLTLREFSSTQKLVLDQPLDRIKGLSISGGDLKFSIDENYTLNIGKYNLQYPENNLELSNLILSPIYSPLEYSRTLDYQKDWFDISVSKLSFNGLNFQKWLDKDLLEIEKASIHQVDAHIYRDKGIPFPMTQVRALPQSMLRGVDIPLKLDSLEMDGDITYQEKSMRSNVASEISFNQWCS